MAARKYHHGDLKNSLVQAGMEILSRDGVEALSLRNVAAHVGVSHSAPYAHFNDKQDLIAAISTEGFRKLYAVIDQVSQAQPDAARRLVEVAWAYVQFALENRGCFKVMFSGTLDNEAGYPEFVKISHENFMLIVQLVADCQRQQVLKPGPEDVLALSVWSLVHGFVSLLLEGQISHTILERSSLQELLLQVLDGIALVKLPRIEE